MSFIMTCTNIKRRTNEPPRRRASPAQAGFWVLFGVLGGTVASQQVDFMLYTFEMNKVKN
jgi:hypothetical protein